MNWWTMRISVDGSGRVDPGRMLAVRQLGFPEVYEAHVAQDALDEIRRRRRARMKADMEARRRARR